MAKQKISKNVKTVLDVLRDEVGGNVEAALRKLTNDYSMTWVYVGKRGKLFPRTGKNMPKELGETYLIKDRRYDIKNLAEGKDVVMVEMIESYADPKTRQKYRTPLVIVLEMKRGKIRKGRHYCDPRLSYLHLTEKQVKRAF
ncbi:MAG: hypothetical protein AAB562_00905 [Patescibacteria group bacterium]